MKTGIIFLFSNDEKEIKENKFETLLIKDSSKFCFVNNASNDRTLERLKEIKETTLKNVSIVDIKKNKGVNAAIKAGVRYLKNNEDFSSIIYFEFSKYSGYHNLEKILTRIINKKEILNFISNTSKRNILKNVFSLEQIIK